MAVVALTGTACYIDDYDFTGDSNKAQLSVQGEALDKTTFGSAGYKELVGGLKSAELSLEGFWQSAASAAVDLELFPDLLGTNVVTLAPTATETDVAYIFRSSKTKVEQFGSVGEVIPFQLAANGSDGQGCVRGQLAKAKGTVSATGALGSVVNLGAVGATSYLYAALHIFGTPGTTITVKVQSDDASNFPSATDVATLGPLTTAGGTWMTRVAGPLTDTFYRLNVSAITGTFTVAGAIGIGS